MPAKSKAQQRFFGMVRATQKGEMKNPSSEILDVADDISVNDAKKMAKTKHKGLPEKVKSEGVTYGYKGKKYKKLPAHVKTPSGWGNDGRGELGKAKDAITDKLGITNTKKHGVLAKEDKLAEGDVPRGPGGNPIRIKDKIKAAKGFIPHKGKPTVEMKESVLNLVRKYGKKRKEKEASKAQDAGARARRALQRKEYASKVSGSTDNVPDDLRDSLQILKRLIK